MEKTAWRDFRMKKLLWLTLLTVLFYTTYGQVGQKHIWVETYSRDGKLIQGHYRTAPNQTNRDNFSTKGNINPYTNEPGWISPDNIPILSSEYTYKFDNASRFDSSIDDCNGYCFGKFRIGQFQQIATTYRKIQDSPEFTIYEVKSASSYNVSIALDLRGFMLGYVVETSSVNIALQILQNLVNYHSLPTYSDENGVVWFGEGYNIVYVKLDNTSTRILPNGKYRFSVSRD
jgi:hypothetical protein